ncbi:hypothetical protein [Geopseudomonas aromaticivorans]
MIAVAAESRIRAPGAGRKPIGKEPLNEKINIRLTEAEHELFKAIGGSRWLRQTLLIAKIKCDIRSGAKPRSAGDGCKATVHIQVRVTHEQAIKFHALGASCWIRQMLNAAAIDPAQT